MIRVGGTMEIRQLKYFKVLCEEKNFTRAAKQLFITQQGLSRSIQLLEEELHTSLVMRNTNPLTITKSGQYLLKKCNEILSEIDDTVDYFLLAESQGSKISVAYNGNAYFMLPDKINTNFVENNPNIAFKLVDLPEIECELKLLNEQVDVTFSANPIDHSKFEVYHLLDIGFDIIVKKDHPLAFYSEVTLENVCNYDVVTIDNRYKGYYIFKAACKEKGITPKTLSVSTSTLTMVQLCRANNMVGITYKHFGQALNTDEMCYVPIKKDDMSYKMYLTLKKGRPKNQIVNNYCNHIINTVKEAKKPKNCDNNTCE